MLTVVPNYVSDEIYKKIDEQLILRPDLQSQRENMFRDLLGYFNAHGVVPDFTLE